MATTDLSEPTQTPTPAPSLSIPVYAVYALPPTPKSTPQSQGEEQDATTSLQDDTERPIVLIAEDEETIAETLAMIVEDAGYSAIVAHDGREALARPDNAVHSLSLLI